MTIRLILSRNANPKISMGAASEKRVGGSRVAPADFSAGALARSVRGQFDHTAPPLIRLMENPRGLHTPLAGEVGSPLTDPETVPSSASLAGFGG